MPAPQDLFQSALARHRAGDLAGAAGLYRRVLAADPRHLDACNNLGVIFAGCGRLDEAIACCRRAIGIRPGDLNARVNLTAALHAAGRVDDAALSLAEALRLAPGEASLHTNLGLLRRQQGHDEDAAACFEAALALAPGDLEARLNLAAIERAGGRIEAAAAHYREILRRAPEHLGACNDYGVLLQEMGRAEQALACFERAAAGAPDHIEIRVNLGGALAELGRYDEALAAFDAALAQAPENADARIARGNALKEMGDLDGAIAEYRAILAREPAHALALANLGLAESWRGERAAAHACYDAALAIEPGSVLARYNRSLLLLSEGRFAEGWADYELRWQTEDNLPREVGLALWDGTPLAGRPILVLGEQGPGDMLMFAQCLPDLAAQAGAVTVTAEPRLVPLLARSFPAIAFEGAHYRAPPEAPPGVELAVAIGSLARHFRPDEASFAGTPARYLTPDPEAVAHWRERLARLGPGLKVGLSWRGGVSRLDRRQRVLDLADWAPLLELDGPRFVNLQYGDHAREIARVERRFGVTIHDWDDADPIAGFDDFAAQVDALDLVITITNTTVHVAGGLGKPVWCLTPAVPSWRWLLERDDSPWYPSARLFRQAAGESWREVLARAARALERHPPTPSTG